MLSCVVGGRCMGLFMQAQNLSGPALFRVFVQYQTAKAKLKQALPGVPDSLLDRIASSMTDKAQPSAEPKKRSPEPGPKAPTKATAKARETPSFPAPRLGGPELLAAIKNVLDDGKVMNRQDILDAFTAKGWEVNSMYPKKHIGFVLITHTGTHFERVHTSGSGYYRIKR